MGTPTIVDVPLVSGRVVRFEESRGYGFIAPDQGGDDVFLHVNDLPTDSHDINCGTRVRFRVIDGGRGPKACDVRLSDPLTAETVAVTGSAGATDDADVICDVLSEQEFRTDVTEVILAADATIDARQVLALRAALCTFAQSHGWVD